jgi:hypothetical protein
MGRPALAAWRGTHDAIGAHPEELDALFEDSLVLATQGTSVVRRDADGPGATRSRFLRSMPREGEAVTAQRRVGRPT